MKNRKKALNIYYNNAILARKTNIVVDIIFDEY